MSLAERSREELASGRVRFGILHGEEGGAIHSCGCILIPSVFLKASFDGIDLSKGVGVVDGNFIGGDPSVRSILLMQRFNVMHSLSSHHCELQSQVGES